MWSFCELILDQSLDTLFMLRIDKGMEQADGETFNVFFL